MTPDLILAAGSKIGTLFALAGLLMFSAAVAVMDTWRTLARLIDEIEKHFGSDELIFPDYEP